MKPRTKTRQNRKVDEQATRLEHTLESLLERLVMPVSGITSLAKKDNPSDVQRVSDTVAIMKFGELVAQAPIDELLAGKEGIVYTVAMKGHINGTQARVANLPWVSAINVLGNSNGTTQWQINVSDENAAENQLLRLLMEDQNLLVTEFGRKKHDLEEVFMNIIGEEKHVN